MPRRRCVGCGRTAPRPQLIRVALAGERGATARAAVLDPECRIQGRGAYLCREQIEPLPVGECLRRAARGGGIARTLRAPAPLDDKLLELLSR